MNENRKFVYSAIVVFIVFFFNNCTQRDPNSVNWDAIEFHLVGDIVHTNDPFLRGLYSPVIIENYIITRALRSELIFRLSQLRNDSLVYIGDFLSKGRGPAEMMSPTLHYAASSNQIVIYDNLSNDKVFYIDAANIQNVFTTNSWKLININHIRNFTYLYPLADYTFLGLLPIQRKATKQMFYYIDLNGIYGLNLLFPTDNSVITDSYQKLQAYKGKIEKHPSTNRFVYFSEMNRYMHIFDFTPDSLITVSTPYTEYPRYSLAADRMNIDRDGDNYVGPITFYAGDKHIYILMNNATYTHLREEKLIDGYPWNMSNCVYIFDWEGNPVKKYVLDHFVRSIFVDSKEQYIYGYADGDESIKLFRYTMK